MWTSPLPGNFYTLFRQGTLIRSACARLGQAACLDRRSEANAKALTPGKASQLRGFTPEASAQPGLYIVPKSFSAVSAKAWQSARRAPPEDLRRIRMSIGNHVQQEVRAASHERQYRA